MAETKIIRNAVRCSGCGLELESTDRHDYRTHECLIATCDKTWRWLDKECTKGEYYTGPRFMMVDGGHSYLRHGFCCREHYINISEVA